MSEKEYEITSSSDGKYVTIKEVPQYSHNPTPTDPTPTLRERIGLKLRNMPKGGKIFLTLFLDIYGILHRWSSNKGLAYLFSFVQIFANILLGMLLVSFLIYNSHNPQAEFQSVFESLSLKNVNDPNIILVWLGLLAIPFWLLDFLCVLFSGEVRILGHKFYPDVID